MNTRTSVEAIDEKRLLSWGEGTAYTGLGRTTFRSWADEIGATRKYGTRVLFDRKVIDEAIDQMTEA